MIPTNIREYPPTDWEADSLALWDILPKDQIEKVMSGYMVDADIEPEFLGFVSIYKRLAELIPYHFTIVDLGSAYNAQSFYFLKYKKYIAVQPHIENIFMTPNCERFKGTTGMFIGSELYSQLDLNTTFAICSYVPPWYEEDSLELCRKNFKNVFTYYPA